MKNIRKRIKDPIPKLDDWICWVNLDDIDKRLDSQRVPMRVMLRLTFDKFIVEKNVNLHWIFDTVDGIAFTLDQDHTIVINETCVMLSAAYVWRDRTQVLAGFGTYGQIMRIGETINIVLE